VRCSNPTRGQASGFVLAAEGRIRRRVLARRFDRLAVHEYEAGELLSEERLQYEDGVAAEHGLRQRREEWEAAGWVPTGWAVYLEGGDKLEAYARILGESEITRRELENYRGAHAKARKQRARRHARYETLHAAIAEGRTEDAIALLDRRYPRRPYDCFFDPALELAALRGYVPLVNRLARTRDQLTLAIVVAAGAGQLPLLRHLIEVRRGDPSAIEVGEASALMAAAEAGHLDAVEYLLARGADPDATVRGENAAELAALAGHAEVARRLAEASDASPEYQTRRLFAAVEGGRADDIARLAALGARLDASNEKGETPLGVAIDRGYGDARVVAALLEAGANPSRPGRDGFTPWMLVDRRQGDSDAAHEQGQIAALLLRAGASREGEVLRALRDAARDGDVAKVEELLSEIGPDAGPTALSPLHAAAGRGHLDVVNVLLARGAAVDRRDPDGPTALIHAARNGQLTVVQRLVRAGADVELEGGSIGNAADHAALNGHPHVAAWLEAHGSASEREIGVRFEKPPRVRLGWKLFERHAAIGNGEHSLILVEAPIAEAAPALAALLDGARHLESIHERPARIARRAWPVYGVQLEGQRWSLFVHAIGSLSWRVFERGRELAAALAQRGWRVVHASENDSDGESWFRLFEGADSTLGKDPGLLRRLGIALPGFDPYARDGIHLFGVTREDVARVDVIEIEEP
jgi:ankyrin repeat protein